MDNILLRLMIIPVICAIHVQMFSQTEVHGNIHLEITHIRNEEGNIKISLFDQAEPFPNDHEQAVGRIIAKIDGSRASAVFEDIPFGEYAISILHDENSNYILDANWIGIPKEGYGASNNPPRRMGPPLYEDAQFILDKPELSLSIKMIYF